MAKRLFEHDALVPSQFSEMLGRQAHSQTGECQLLIAVLQDAIEWFQKNALSGNRQFEDAERWIMRKSETSDAALSFEYVCSVLDLDPEYVRQKLLRWRAAERARSGCETRQRQRSRRRDGYQVRQ
jgi:hypothetical protein